MRVDPDGTISVAADDLRFPNGTVITPDGATLIVGESYGGALTAFDVAADGTLSGRREWAKLHGAVPRRHLPRRRGLRSGRRARSRVACCASGRAARSPTS